MYHIFFIRSSVVGHFGCFHVLAIVNSAAVNIGVHVSFRSMVFSGVCKSNKQKPQLNRAGRQEGALSCPVTIVEPSRKKKGSSSFMARVEPMKSHGLFIYSSPPNFLFPSMKASFFLCHVGTCTWLTMVADPESQFSADPK